MRDVAMAFIGLGAGTVLGQSSFVIPSICHQVTRRPARRVPHIVRAPVRCNEPDASTQSSSTESATASGSSSSSTQTAASTSASAAESSSGSSQGKNVDAAEARSFRERFEHLRGAEIETVSNAMTRFAKAFNRPIPIVYRTVVNETISTTHLARVCAMWRFDAIFAYGFNAIFSIFLRYYPSAEERDRLFRAVVESLRFEMSTIQSAATEVAEWLDGKTEQDVFDALDAAAPGSSTETVGPVIEAMAYIRDAGYGDWYYSRLFGIGLIQIMATVGVELTAANAEKWAERIGVDVSKFSAEMGNYLSGLERLKQAEQIFAEAAAREAKKAAERLAAKAKQAAEEAAMLESGQDTDLSEKKTESESSSQQA